MLRARSDRFMLKLFPLVATVALLTFAGCSSTGSGGKDANGTNPLSETDLNAQREARFAGGNIPLAEEESGLFRNVYFDFDSAVVNSGGREDAQFNAKVLQENPDVHITLEGHCDERGTAEYNLALGEKRARAVRELLTSLGVPGSRLETISYGKEVPLDPGHDEAAWKKNRRVHFSASRGQ